MTEFDTIQRFLFQEAPVRGEIVRLQATYQAILERHPYPPVVGKLLGEALSAAALLSASIKFVGSLILQLQGDGPLNLLVVQSNNDYHLRGLAKWQGEVPEDFQQAVGQGHMAITITPAEGERYQGVVDLNSYSLSAAIEAYFAQSEQLPTCLCLFADEHVAAGLLLQALPQKAMETEASLQHQQEFWEHIVHLTRTIKADELLALPNEDILRRLYFEEDIQLFEADPVSFRCTCTVERMERALRMMDYAEVKELLSTYKKVTVTCEFCHHHYDFDAVDIERIFADGSSSGGTSTQH